MRGFGDVPLGNHYEVLGLTPAASAEEIERAFRRLAMRWHPDRNPADAARATSVFVRLRTAHDTLTDPVLRRDYDRTLERNRAPREPFAGAREGFASTRRHHAEASRSTGRRSYEEPRGEDAEDVITITYAEAIFGARREFRFKAPQTCRACTGSGLDPDHRCRQLVFAKTFGGRHERFCQECGGTGEADYPCQVCRGKRTTRRPRHAEITIPPGILEGEALRLRGLGGDHPGGGRRGDAQLAVMFAVDAHFRHAGLDLHGRIDVNPLELLVGGTVRIDTPRGALDVAIPRRSDGKTIRLRGLGLLDRRTNETGDLLLEARPAPFDADLDVRPDEEAVLRRMLERNRSRR